MSPFQPNERCKSSGAQQSTLKGWDPECAYITSSHTPSATNQSHDFPYIQGKQNDYQKGDRENAYWGQLAITLGLIY